MSKQLAGAKQVQLKRRATGIDALAPMRRTMGHNMSLTRRLLLAATLATGLRHRRLRSAQVKEIRIDYATYNPVSLVLKDKGFLEKELAKDGITVRWVQSARLQQGAGIPQRRLDRFRLDGRRRRADRQDQRQPDQVDLRLFRAPNGPRW